MRKLSVGMLAVVLLLVGAAFALLARQSDITKAAFDRIEAGMSLAEVEATLGGPPVDYTTVPLERDLPPTGLPMAGECLSWDGDEGIIFVTVDADGIVCSKEFGWARPEKVGFLELLRWRLERLQVRTFGTSP